MCILKNRTLVSCLLLALALLLSLSSCVYKKTFISTSIKSHEYVPVFVSMPQSNFVFENVAPLMYQALFQHFQKVGYTLACQENNGYALKTIIKKIDPYQKYVSPDVLVFHLEVKLELHCQLYNFARKLVTEKTFYFSTLICKPRNPILTSSFLIFEYEKLMKRSVPRIEQYFRPYLKDAFVGKPFDVSTRLRSCVASARQASFQASPDTAA
ncbi:MAG: hypothetical protein ABH827_04015 [bacterium]